MERKSLSRTRITPELMTVTMHASPPPPPPSRPPPLPRRARYQRPWLVVLLLVVLAAVVGTASADEPDPADETEESDEDFEEPAWDPEPPVTRGGPPPAVNTSTPTANGLRFTMEVKVGLATKPVAIDAGSANGGKIVVFTTGRWKAAAGPEKEYRLFLERLEGTRWVAVERVPRRAKLGQNRVRHEWHVRDRASYRVTVMARPKTATGPLLRVEGEVRTVVYR